MNTKEIEAIVKAYNKGRIYPAGTERFTEHAQRYIKAIKEGRMICSIGGVSKTGESRTIKFVEVAKNGKPCNKAYSMLNFHELFLMLDYSPAKNSDYFRIGGGGMDMIFHTNYSIIGQLHRLGFMSRKTSDKLRQMTPPVI